MVVVDGGAQDPAARIERLLDLAEPEIRKAFLAAVKQIRDSHTIDELAAMIETGQLAPFFDAVRPAAALFAASYGTVVTNAGVDTAAFLSDKALVNNVAFNRSRARVFAVLNNEQQRLIQIFTTEQNQTIRDVLQDGFSRGINPREQARALRESIGITPRQEKSVQNFREMLTGRQNGLPSRTALSRSLRDRRFDRTIERALREKVPLTEDQIEKMTSRYRSRMVNFHAEVVARTEALSAVHQGSELMYEQAIEDGELTRNQLVRTWVTARDERVRESHRALNGQKRGFGPDQVWVAAGGTLRFPGDPQAPLSETAQCRCILTVRILDESQAAAA